MQLHPPIGQLLIRPLDSLRTTKVKLLHRTPTIRFRAFNYAIDEACADEFRLMRLELLGQIGVELHHLVEAEDRTCR